MFRRFKKFFNDNRLLKEIFDALKGQKYSIGKFGVEFKLLYDSYDKSELPNYVVFNNSPSAQKEFGDAISLLFEKLSNRDLSDKSEEDKLKLIRYELALILVNHIFKDEILEFKRNRRAAIKKVKKFFEGKFDRNESILEIYSKEELLDIFPERALNYLEQFQKEHLTYWLQYFFDQSSNVKKWVNNNEYINKLSEKKIKSIIHNIKSINGFMIDLFMYTNKSDHTEDCESSEYDQAEMPIEELLDVIKAQEEVFFWKPSQKNKYNLKNTIHIAFFYLWISICSGINPKIIAKELNVNKSTISRWNSSIELEIREKYFNEKYFFSPFPFSFSEEALISLKMFDENIRTYRLKSGDESIKIKMITECKKALWSIYITPRDSRFIDSMSENEMQNTRDQSYAVIIDDEIEIEYIVKFKTNVGKKAVHPLLHIQNIQLTFNQI